MVVSDATVVDLTERLADPADAIFGVRLGGGTDVNQAAAYCQELITSRGGSIFVLISDLYEGGVCEEPLALSDDGAPVFNRELAAELQDLNVTAFACTPDVFPDLMAAAISGDGLQAFVTREGLVPELGE